MYSLLPIFLMTAVACAFFACKNKTADESQKGTEDSVSCCSSNLPKRFASKADTAISTGKLTSHDGMVWIAGGTFKMGAVNNEGRRDEYPQHEVKVDGFWMDVTEVTNAQFKKFVDATGYKTTAEKTPDWSELKKQLPPGTPKPHDSLLVASSLVFTPPTHPVPLNDASQWWSWKKGADWKHPQGQGGTPPPLQPQPASPTPIKERPPPGHPDAHG